MRLCKAHLVQINANATIQLPGQKVLQLPEKVMQFGTGVLLRGLADFIIDKANINNNFNGRVVVVKSTSTGNTDAFKLQDCLYTLCVRGIEHGELVQTNQVISAISRVLSATAEWEEILKCAQNPEMQIIISNTTEVGLTLVPDDISLTPPISFPGKLLAFLLARFTCFNGDAEKGFVIIPTELLPDNGKLLLGIILQLAIQNSMDPIFIEWIKSANYFCNSLVDRIVPGKMLATDQQPIETALGYQDELMIICEPYYLWAIETGNDKVKAILSFANGNNNVVIAPDIEKFRQLKLRLLNGSHTLSCGLAYLAGFNTVKEAMSNIDFASYIRRLMFNELVPAICSNQLTKQEAELFAIKVLDRFSNNFIAHKWLSITMQYSAKMNTRNAGVINEYIKRFKAVPQNMALGMAAHILFMRGEELADGKYYGTIDGNKYLIDDNNAAIYSSVWKEKDISRVVAIILNDVNIWKQNEPFETLFIADVLNWLTILIKNGVAETLLMINKK